MARARDHSHRFLDLRITYLSDLDPILVEQTPYFDRVHAFHRDENLAGEPLALRNSSANPNRIPRDSPSIPRPPSPTLFRPERSASPSMLASIHRPVPPARPRSLSPPAA